MEKKHIYQNSVHRKKENGQRKIAYIAFGHEDKNQ